MNPHDTDPAWDCFNVSLPSNPYPGLRPFEKREWPIFFGREQMIDEIIDRLVRQQLVVVHGDSGCGKSSVIRAGVLAHLEQEGGRGGVVWRTCASRPGDAPLQLLAEALAELDGAPGDEGRITELRRVLNFGADAPEALAKMLRRGPSDHLCLLVDQFEELFAFAKRHGPSDARLFVQLLVALLERPQPGLYAVVTMRSEFLGACAQYPGFAEAVNRAQYLLPRMGHSDLVRAVREPATLYSGHVSADLAERLISDAGGGQDVLPLIQHGLAVLSRRKMPPEARGETPAAGAGHSWRLDLEDYRNVTGLAAMLSTHADDLAKPDDPVRFSIVEKLFRALTDINAEGQAIRRPQPLAKLVEVTGAHRATLVEIIDSFRAEGASLLTPYAPAPLTDDGLVDISHEALIRCWRRIADSSDPKQGWLVHEFEDGLIWRALLVQTTSFDLDPSNTLSKATADDRHEWLRRHEPMWAERHGGNWTRVESMITASVEAGHRAEMAERRRQTQTQKERFTFIAGVVLSVFLIVALFLNN